jgi:ATP adenylyltransferase
MEYIRAPKTGDGCVFCGVKDASESERRERLVVASTARAFVVLNRYPFAAGHLLVVPHAHAGALDALDPDDYDALFRLVRVAVACLVTATKPEGFNVGMNLGACAGAGVAEHLHVHVVPRWAGDTNFMPVLAETRVIPEALESTRERLAPYFAGIDA